PPPRRRPARPRRPRRRWHCDSWSASLRLSRLACRRPASGSARFANVTVRHMSKDSLSTRYGADVLAAPARRPETPEVEAEPGLVVEDVETGWGGGVVRTEKRGGVHVGGLEDRPG